MNELDTTTCDLTLIKSPPGNDLVLDGCGHVALSGDLASSPSVDSSHTGHPCSEASLTISDAALINALRTIQNIGLLGEERVALGFIEQALNERDLLLIEREKHYGEDARAALTENVAKWMCWSDRATYIFHSGKFARDSSNYWLTSAAPNLKQKWRNLASTLLSGGAEGIVDTALPAGAPIKPETWR